MTEFNFPIVQAWQTHCRLAEQFLQAIPPATFSAKLDGKGRTVGAIFAHMHNNRLDWLKPGAPELLDGLEKIRPNDTGSPDSLLDPLAASGVAVASWLASSLEKDGKVKAFGGHAASFMGYLIAHESYHLGEIGLILSHTGFPLNKQEAYALWNWK